MTETQIKTKAGYVEVEGFREAGPGYFCGTCVKLRYDGDRSGFCTGLRVPVRTYGCCNNWEMAPDSMVRGANGRRLRVIVG